MQRMRHLIVTTMPRMSMGTRETDQSPFWIAVSDLPASPGHPFYARLNAVLHAHRFDRFVEGCQFNPVESHVALENV